MSATVEKVISKVKDPQPTTGKDILDVTETIQPGEWIRQGDVYIKRLPDNFQKPFEETCKLLRATCSWIFSSPDLDLADGHTAHECGAFVFQGFAIDELRKNIRMILPSKTRARFKDWPTKEVKALNVALKDVPGVGLIFKAPQKWYVPHKEHAEVRLPAGLFVSWPQLEVDPLSGRLVQVID